MSGTRDAARAAAAFVALGACGGDAERHPAPAGPPLDGPLFHNDRARTGWNSVEQALTPASVAGRRFGEVWSSPQLDAITIGGRSYAPHLYASPLYVDQLAITGGRYTDGIFGAVIAATNNGDVYAIAAFDAHGVSAGTILWHAQLGTPELVASLDGGLPLGVLATPALDLAAKPPRIYVAAITDGTWRAFALDLGSGALLAGWPVDLDAATLDALDGNGPATFADATTVSQRSALVLDPAGTTLYVSFGAYFDGATGWMTAIDTQAPAVRAAFSAAPSSAPTASGGMWSPGGAAVDRDGRVFASTGNSPEGSGPAPHVWGESVLAWTPALQLAATYTPWNYCELDVDDADLGGSSPILFDLDPAMASPTPHLAAFGGKQGNVYLVDRDALGGGTLARPPCSSDSSTDPSLLPPDPQPQFGKRGPLNVFGPYSETVNNLDTAKMRSALAMFGASDGATYLFAAGTTKASGVAGDPAAAQSVPPCVVRLRVVAAAPAPAYLAVDAQETTLALVNPGSPEVSSNGGEAPIVWVLDENAPRTASLADPNAPHPMLYAIDGTTMQVLWRTGDGELAVGGKYGVPLVARGLVVVGTDRLQAFGVRP